VVARLRRQRDRARIAAVVGVVLLFVLGYGLRGVLDILGYAANDAGPLGGWILLLAVAYTLGAIVAWLVAGWRLHRANDPWRYDPDLDGPDPERPRDPMEDELRRT